MIFPVYGRTTATDEQVAGVCLWYVYLREGAALNHTMNLCSDGHSAVVQTILRAGGGVWGGSRCQPPGNVLYFVKDVWAPPRCAPSLVTHQPHAWPQEH